MKLVLEPYLQQEQHWPKSGRHILAQFDDETIVVYQAYKPSIGEPAAATGRFGAGFKLERMSWIKPNFLWMMYRCGWASKPDQETVLALTLRRSAFDAYLAAAVHSSFVSEVYGDHSAWSDAVKRSDVRLQWDPDHAPSGADEERRAIQLGLRGAALRSFTTSDLVAIENVTELAKEQSRHKACDQWARLMLPRERVYPVVDPAVAQKLGVSRGSAPPAAAPTRS